MTSFHLYAASPHQWGPGKIHTVDPLDESRTVCGRLLEDTPGTPSNAPAPTCIGCIKATEARVERERRSMEDRDRMRQAAERKAAAIAELSSMEDHVMHRQMPFGKYRGESLGWIAENDAGYLVWLEENATNMRASLRADISIILSHLRASGVMPSGGQ